VRDSSEKPAEDFVLSPCGGLETNSPTLAQLGARPNKKYLADLKLAGVYYIQFAFRYKIPVVAIS